MRERGLLDWLKDRLPRTEKSEHWTQAVSLTSDKVGRPTLKRGTTLDWILFCLKIRSGKHDLIILVSHDYHW